MKKGIIIFIVVAMFGWAVYDFAIKSDDTNGSEQDDYTVEDEPGTPLAEPDEPEDGANTETGLEAGDVAPDFELETLDGETVKLSDYRGERVMLNFWATWCPPCRAEMPDMQKFHEDTDIVILAVDLLSTESDKKNIEDFVDEFGVTFKIPLDEDSDVATQYQIQPIPTSFLIDSEGVIHNKALGALNYELMVQEYEKMK